VGWKDDAVKQRESLCPVTGLVATQFGRSVEPSHNHRLWNAEYRSLSINSTSIIYLLGKHRSLNASVS
jgi:hypothetical protein